MTEEVSDIIRDQHRGRFSATFPSGPICEEIRRQEDGVLHSSAFDSGDSEMKTNEDPRHSILNFLMARYYACCSYRIEIKP